MVELTEAPIGSGPVIDRVRSSEAGAVCLFLGTVRELTAGRATSWLEYEAYEHMALRKLEEIERRARERNSLVDVAIVHRLGRLDPGEVAVAVAVSAAHRDAAFGACSWIMDTIKHEAPIWKREHWADGAEEWIHPGLDDGSTPRVE